jgi:3-hydroxyisobutyrate dehydrogenase
MHVGFIGLRGDVASGGAAMARHIARAGFDVVVWRDDPEGLEHVADFPHDVTETLAELGARCEVVCLGYTGDVESMALDAPDFVATVDALLGSMRPGSVLSNHRAFGSPAELRALAERARARGLFVLDAMGSDPLPDPGRKPWQVMMVGGDPEGVATAEPVIASFAETVHLMGGPGSGQVAKLLNTAVYDANAANLAEALDFGAALGLDRRALVGLLQQSSGSSYALKTLLHYQRTPDLLARVVPIFGSRLDLLTEDAAAKGVEPSPLLDRARVGAEGLEATVAALPEA